MSGKSSRNKGHNEERSVTNEFKAAGLAAERNLSQTRDQGCDVITDRFAVECKRQEQVRFAAWIAQAEHQAEQHGKDVLLTIKQNRKPRYAVVRFDTLLELMQADAEAEALAEALFSEESHED